MKVLLRLALLTILTVFGAVAFIRYTYGCSWKESFDVADRFVEDLLG
mgnify:CR=1 FL=1